MGVGFAEDLVVCCALGVDMYDCVFPTRTAVSFHFFQQLGFNAFSFYFVEWFFIIINFKKSTLYKQAKQL